MSTSRLAVERALAGVGPFSRATAESILEIAYLTMAVDEELRDEEIEAFSIIAATMLHGSGKQGSLDDPSLRTWLDRFGDDLSKENIDARLEAAVAKLGDDHAAKLASYRVACLMAMSDLDAADQRVRVRPPAHCSAGSRPRRGRCDRRRSERRADPA